MYSYKSQDFTRLSAKQGSAQSEAEAQSKAKLRAKQGSVILCSAQLKAVDIYCFSSAYAQQY